MTGDELDTTPWLRQNDRLIRFEWGPSGVEAVAGDVVVVIDVLRFTTAVDAGVSRGAVVFPCRWKDAHAKEFALQKRAVLADSDDPSGISLSPIALLALNAGDRVVLPSPNGSTCALVASESGATVVASCLQNFSAVAAWVNDQASTVTVVACGERWPDGSLRPSLEDYLGAGAVISALSGSRSPEAEVAALAWEASQPHVVDIITSCVSGKEAVLRGWSGDLDYALTLNTSSCVPVLRDGGFVNITPIPLQ
jgi:2-phosphosulfolactate phosphatase